MAGPQVNSTIGTHHGSLLHGVMADVMNAAVRCWLPGLRRAPDDTITGTVSSRFQS